MKQKKIPGIIVFCYKALLQSHMFPLLVMMSETQDPRLSVYAYPEQNRRSRNPFPSPLSPFIGSGICHSEGSMLQPGGI